MVKILKNKYIIGMLKFIGIYFVTLIILVSLLTLASKIPKESIQKHITESAEYYKKKEGIEEFLKRRDYTFLHYYADSILLNIIYSEDSEHPLESAMWAKYYERVKMDTNSDFVKMVEGNLEPNQQYVRYWHGSIIILKPLLCFFYIEQIYLINRVLLYLLALVLLVLLFKRNKMLSIIFLLAMVMIAFPVVPLCIEYSWTFYLMLIASIVAICIEKKGDKYLYYLFFITGMLTCFFDFLTTEIITLFVPLLLVLGVRKKEKRIDGFKECVLFIIKATILWGITYVLMWLSKYILASIVLNINAFEYVIDNALVRINGLEHIESKQKMYTGALYNNIHAIYPFNIVKNTAMFWLNIGIVFSVILALVDWKKIKEKWFSLLMLMVGVVPYIRYLILANHSYRHAFFTFRSQIITIIALGLLIFDCFNKRLIKWKK